MKKQTKNKTSNNNRIGAWIGSFIEIIVFLLLQRCITIFIVCWNFIKCNPCYMSFLVVKWVTSSTGSQFAIERRTFDIYFNGIIHSHSNLNFGCGSNIRMHKITIIISDAFHILNWILLRFFVEHFYIRNCKRKKVKNK